MGGGYRKKRTPKSIKKFKKQFRTSCRPKDLDQIHTEMLARQNKMEQGQQMVKDKIVPLDGDIDDLPGNGEFPCYECDKNFIDSHALETHIKSKVHKRRIKLLQREAPFSHKESEAAGGSNSNDFYMAKETLVSQ